MASKPKKGLLLWGVFSSENIDSSAEVLDVRGADLSVMEEGHGLVNYEHNKGKVDEETGETEESPKHIVGKVVTVKKVLKAADAETKLEKQAWERLKVPFICGIIRLFDQAGHEEAKRLAAQLRDAAANEEKQTLRFSIEGHVLSRDPKDKNRIKTSICKMVALTNKPANKACDTVLLEDPGAPEGFEVVPESEEAEDLLAQIAKDVEALGKAEQMVQLGGSVENAWQEVRESRETQGDDRESLVKLVAKLALLKKAVAAGGYGGAPGSLTGMAALSREHISGSKKKVAKLIKNYLEKPVFNKAELRAILKAQMPDVSDEFIEHFINVADDYRVQFKKSATPELSETDLSDLPADDLDASFDFGDNVRLLDDARRSIARMAPANRQMAEQWINFTSGKHPHRPKITPELERHLAKFGIVDPAGYAYDERGRALDGRGTPGKTRSGKGYGPKGEQPQELKRIRLDRAAHAEGVSLPYHAYKSEAFLPEVVAAEALLVDLKKALMPFEKPKGNDQALREIAPRVFHVYGFRPNAADPESMDRHQIGRFTTAGNHLHILEDYHDEIERRVPEGLLTAGHLGAIHALNHTPGFEVVPLSHILDGKRPDLAMPKPQRQSSHFEITRPGQNGTHYLYWGAQGPHLNGQKLSPDQTKALLEEAKSGAAVVRYKKDRGMSAIKKMEEALGDLFRKSSSEEAATAEKVHQALGRLDELVKAGHLEPHHAEALRAHAFKDPMTGGALGNKFALTDFLNRAQSQGGVHIALDANGMKSINDTLGHEAGDQAIKAMGKALRAAVDETAGPEVSFLARAGGDEFHCHVPTMEHAAAFVRAAQRHLDKVPHIGGTHKLSMSFGIAHTPKHADVALYKAKEQKIGPDGQKKYGPGNTPHFAHSLYPGAEGPIHPTTSSPVMEPPKPPEPAKSAPAPAPAG